MYGTKYPPNIKINIFVLNDCSFKNDDSTTPIKTKILSPHKASALAYFAQSLNKSNI